MPRNYGVIAALLLAAPLSAQTSPTAEPIGLEPYEIECVEKSESGAIESLLSTAAAPWKKAWNWGAGLLRNDNKPTESVVIEEAAPLSPPTPLKVRSIQYIAEMDNQSYPHVVDSLLASLDDADEEVRHAALAAIHEKAVRYQCEFEESTRFVQSGQCDCAGCRSDRRVAHRIEAYLLDRRRSNGRLREQSERNRNLALKTMMFCLGRDRGNRIESAVETELASEAGAGQAVGVAEDSADAPLRLTPVPAEAETILLPVPE